MKTYILLLPLMMTGWIFHSKRHQHSINKLQVIGSHNSYKEYIDTPLITLIKKQVPAIADGIEYGNCSLSQQLNLGLRGLEIDLYSDALGGRYAHPGGLQWAGANPHRPYDPEGLMKEPGFKVFHVQDIDFRSNCLTLKKCLEELKQWSDEHPAHSPIFVTMNAKDDTIRMPGFTIPEKFTATSFAQLDNTIRQVLGTDKLITPDMVRGRYPTLEAAVLNKHWPKKSESAGKFIFILDEAGEKLRSYTEDHPSLIQRVMFVNAPAGSAEAAIVVINDPVKDFETIRALVKKGYIVRTRADADTREARINDKSRFVAACKSGAQIISTDYYTKSTLFNSDYVIHFDKGKYARSNPVLR